MNGRELFVLFILAAIWGASFLFIRIASPEVGPLITIQGRVSIAAAVLLIYMLLKKKQAQFRLWWKQYLLLGTLNAALPFVMIAQASLHITASMAAILNSMTPLFTAIVVSFWMKEAITVKKWFGIGLGILGVIVLVGWSPLPITFEIVVAVTLSILSTICYAVGGVYAKKTFTGVSTLSLSVGQQVAASIVLLPMTLTIPPVQSVHFTPIVVLSIATLAILCTAVAYLMYFYLMEKVGPTKTLSVTFLVPLFGTIWGAIFLKEQVTIGVMSGLIMILFSIFLISDISLAVRPKRKRVA